MNYFDRIETEPEVHIIEKYFQAVLQCFTMTNIRLKGGKEIDLLAINPRTGEKYHIEARVSTTLKIKLKDTYTSSGKPHRRCLDYFDREKFSHPTTTRRLWSWDGSRRAHRIPELTEP